MSTNEAELDGRTWRLYGSLCTRLCFASAPSKVAPLARRSLNCALKSMQFIENKKNADAWMQLGIAFSNVCNFQKAEEVFSRIIQEFPSYPRGYFCVFMLAQSLAHCSKYDESARCLQHLIDFHSEILKAAPVVRNFDTIAVKFDGGVTLAALRADDVLSFIQDDLNWVPLSLTDLWLLKGWLLLCKVKMAPSSSALAAAAADCLRRAFEIECSGDLGDFKASLNEIRLWKRLGMHCLGLEPPRQTFAIDYHRLEELRCGGGTLTAAIFFAIDVLKHAASAAKQSQNGGSSGAWQNGSFHGGKNVNLMNNHLNSTEERVDVLLLLSYAHARVGDSRAALVACVEALGLAAPLVVEWGRENEGFDRQHLVRAISFLYQLGAGLRKDLYGVGWENYLVKIQSRFRGALTRSSLRHQGVAVTAVSGRPCVTCHKMLCSCYDTNKVGTDGEHFNRPISVDSGSAFELIALQMQALKRQLLLQVANRVEGEESLQPPGFGTEQDDDKENLRDQDGPRRDQQPFPRHIDAADATSSSSDSLRDKRSRSHHRRWRRRVEACTASGNASSDSREGGSVMFQQRPVADRSASERSRERDDRYRRMHRHSRRDRRDRDQAAGVAMPAPSTPTVGNRGGLSAKTIQYSSQAEPSTLLPMPPTSPPPLIAVNALSSSNLFASALLTRTSYSSYSLARPLSQGQLHASSPPPASMEEVATDPSLLAAPVIPVSAVGERGTHHSCVPRMTIARSTPLRPPALKLMGSSFPAGVGGSNVRSSARSTPLVQSSNGGASPLRSVEGSRGIKLATSIRARAVHGLIFGSRASSDAASASNHSIALPTPQSPATKPAVRGLGIGSRLAFGYGAVAALPRTAATLSGTEPSELSAPRTFAQLSMPPNQKGNIGSGVDAEAPLRIAEPLKARPPDAHRSLLSNWLPSSKYNDDDWRAKIEAVCAPEWAVAVSSGWTAAEYEQALAAQPWSAELHMRFGMFLLQWRTLRSQAEAQLLRAVELLEEAIAEAREAEDSGVGSRAGRERDSWSLTVDAVVSGTAHQSLISSSLLVEPVGSFQALQAVTVAVLQLLALLASSCSEWEDAKGYFRLAAERCIQSNQRTQLILNAAKVAAAAAASRWGARCGVDLAQSCGAAAAVVDGASNGDDARRRWSKQFSSNESLRFDVFAEARDRAEAMSLFREVLTSNPTHPEALRAFSGFLLDSAAAPSSLCLSFPPSSPLSDAGAVNKAESEAESLLRLAASLVDDSPASLAASLRCLGVMLLLRADRSRIGGYSRSKVDSKRGPSHDAIRDGQRLDAGHLDEAEGIECLRRSLELEPSAAEGDTAFELALAIDARAERQRLFIDAPFDENTLLTARIDAETAETCFGKACAQRQIDPSAFLSNTRAARRAGDAVELDAGLGSEFSRPDQANHFNAKDTEDQSSATWDGSVRLALQHWDDCTESLQQMVRAVTTSRAALASVRADESEAAALYLRVLRIDPSHTVSAWNRARVLLRRCRCQALEWGARAEALEEAVGALRVLHLSSEATAAAASLSSLVITTSGSNATGTFEAHASILLHFAQAVREAISVKVLHPRDDSVGETSNGRLASVALDYVGGAAVGSTDLSAGNHVPAYLPLGRRLGFALAIPAISLSTYGRSCVSALIGAYPKKVSLLASKELAKRARITLAAALETVAARRLRDQVYFTQSIFTDLGCIATEFNAGGNGMVRSRALSRSSGPRSLLVTTADRYEVMAAPPGSGLDWLRAVGRASAAAALIAFEEVVTVEAEAGSLLSEVVQEEPSNAGAILLLAEFKLRCALRADTAHATEQSGRNSAEVPILKSGSSFRTSSNEPLQGAKELYQRCLRVATARDVLRDRTHRRVNHGRAQRVPYRARAEDVLVSAAAALDRVRARAALRLGELSLWCESSPVEARRSFALALTLLPSVNSLHIESVLDRIPAQLGMATALSTINSRPSRVDSRITRQNDRPLDADDAAECWFLRSLQLLLRIRRHCLIKDHWGDRKRGSLEAPRGDDRVVIGANTDIINNSALMYIKARAVLLGECVYEADIFQDIAFFNCRHKETHRWQADWERAVWGYALFLRLCRGDSISARTVLSLITRDSSDGREVERVAKNLCRFYSETRLNEIQSWSYAESKCLLLGGALIQLDLDFCTPLPATGHSSTFEVLAESEIESIESTMLLLSRVAVHSPNCAREYPASDLSFVALLWLSRLELRIALRFECYRVGFLVACPVEGGLVPARDIPDRFIVGISRALAHLERMLLILINVHPFEAKLDRRSFHEISSNMRINRSAKLGAYGWSGLSAVRGRWTGPLLLRATLLILAAQASQSESIGPKRLAQLHESKALIDFVATSGSFVEVSTSFACGILALVGIRQPGDAIEYFSSAAQSSAPGWRIDGLTSDARGYAAPARVVRALRHRTHIADSALHAQSSTVGLVLHEWAIFRKKKFTPPILSAGAGGDGMGIRPDTVELWPENSWDSVLTELNALIAATAQANSTGGSALRSRLRWAGWCAASERWARCQIAAANAAPTVAPLLQRGQLADKDELTAIEKLQASQLAAEERQRERQRERLIDERLERAFVGRYRNDYRPVIVSASAFSKKAKREGAVAKSSMTSVPVLGLPASMISTVQGPHASHGKKGVGVILDAQSAPIISSDVSAANLLQDLSASKFQRRKPLGLDSSLDVELDSEFLSASEQLLFGGTLPVSLSPHGTLFASTDPALVDTTPSLRSRLAQKLDALRRAEDVVLFDSSSGPRDLSGAKVDGDLFGSHIRAANERPARGRSKSAKLNRLRASTRGGGKAYSVATEAAARGADVMLADVSAPFKSAVTFVVSRQHRGKLVVVKRETRRALKAKDEARVALHGSAVQALIGAPNLGNDGAQNSGAARIDKRDSAERNRAAGVLATAVGGGAVESTMARFINRQMESGVAITIENKGGDAPARSLVGRRGGVASTFKSRVSLKARSDEEEGAHETAAAASSQPGFPIPSPSSPIRPAVLPHSKVANLNVNLPMRPNLDVKVIGLNSGSSYIVSSAAIRRSAEQRGASAKLC